MRFVQKKISMENLSRKRFDMKDG